MEQKENQSKMHEHLLDDVYLKALWDECRRLLSDDGIHTFLSKAVSCLLGMAISADDIPEALPLPTLHGS